jgi:type II secretory pathway predicted ATPase ExeA
MYETYWQLDEKPFENCADPRFYYPGESPQAALLKLRYAVENRRGGALLTGASGTGKTLIVAMLRRMLGESHAPFVHMVFPQMSTADLLAYLADELDGSPSNGENGGVQTSIRRIERFLGENAGKGRHAVIVVDEAHLIASAETWEAIRLLMNFEIDRQPALSLLLSGQTGMLPMLDRMPQLDERLGVKCLMRPFTVEETAAYATHRLKTAGAKRTIIDSDAFPTLHELTCGVARRINRLCDLALLIGYAEERKILTAAHFESVCQELVTIAPE